MIMDIKNLLISKAKEIGVKVSPAQAEQFQIYLDLLLERNTVMNLTAITDPEEAVIKHFVDSLTLLKALEIKKNAKVIDVGTGAGFPGIPLKIMRPDIELTLLDSLNKRLVFLREVCDAIGIEAETISYVWDGDSPTIWEDTTAWNDSAIVSPAMGFTWDNANVLNEVTAVRNVRGKYANALECGSIDPAEALPAFLEELETAGANTIIEEKQKQLDEYLASKE